MSAGRDQLVSYALATRGEGEQQKRRAKVQTNAKSLPAVRAQGSQSSAHITAASCSSVHQASRRDVTVSTSMRIPSDGRDGRSAASFSPLVGAAAASPSDDG